MDHGFIQEHQVISLYLMGTLAPADRVMFEDHLVSCPQCQNELELTDDFRHTLRRVVAEDEFRGSVPQGAAGWLSRFRAWQRAAMLAAAALALAGFIGVIFVAQRRTFEGELRRTRAASADWERRYANERQLRQGAENQPRDTMAQATPLFFLNLTRAADMATAEPSNVVSIPAAAASIVLAPEWQNDPAFQSYRAALTGAGGRTVWSDAQIPPPSSGALAITLPANLLQPGKYVLTLEGAIAGRYSMVGRYSFRASVSK